MRGCKSFEADTGFWDMNGNNSERRAVLANDIRRQAGTETTKRFLRTLPAFRLENEVPRQFQELLDRLDGAETVSAGGKHRQ